MKPHIITYTIKKTPKFHDSNDVYFKIDGKGVRGYAYQSKEDGRLHIMRCPRCGRENYALAVPEGTCVWCGLDANMLTITPDMLK